MAEQEPPLDHLSPSDQINFERLLVERDRSMLEGQLAFATTGIKNLILMSGGAAIALLAFLGHANEKGQPGSSSLGIAMLVFGYGAAAGGLCAILAYIFQTLAREFPQQFRRLKIAVRLVAVGIAFVGLGCFVVGLQLSARALTGSG